MQEIYDEIVKVMNNGDTASLATVVSTKGSTPRSSGAKMLVKGDGSITGSIGGGCLEADVWQVCMDVIKEQKPKLLEFDLTGREENASGLICGGIIEVFVDPVISTPTVFIFGAGHIGFAVSKIAKIAGFRIVVIDDRPNYANKERFPDADEFVIDDIAQAVQSLSINRVSYVVIACRGHLEDQEVLEQALKTDAAYIGMIGSKKKVKTIFGSMKEKGFTQASLDRVSAPIGVSIAAETPEDIAVSIVAEMTDVRRGKSGSSAKKANKRQAADE
ncbi:MAG: xanthine dehydrogenase [Desulfatiglans sp.]|jgi:xanthine dehydrogenase accessory factor|nr:xanthine dehydrogenase [Desulfatiglans sp.]